MRVPIQSGSEIKAILLFASTSMHIFPNLTTGHDFLHSWPHFLGLHLSEPTMAIRVIISSSLPVSVFFLGAMMLLFWFYTIYM